METNQITDKLIEHSESLSRHSADIAAIAGAVDDIKKRSEEHGAIVESIHELALSVRELTGKVADVDGRLAAVEHDRSEKNRTVWQIALSAFAGGLATYIFSLIAGA